MTHCDSDSNHYVQSYCHLNSLMHFFQNIEFIRETGKQRLELHNVPKTSTRFGLHRCFFYDQRKRYLV